MVSQLQTCLDESVGECPAAHGEPGPGWVRRVRCRARAGHGGCGAGYEPGVSTGIRPFAASPKITCGQGRGISKAGAGAASLQPSAQAFSLPRGSRDAMSPSSIPAATKPALPPCAFAVSSRAEPAAAGTKLPPARRLPAASVAFQEPAQEPLAADKRVATDASCCLPKPRPPAHLQQGKIMAGVSSHGATCSATLSPNMSLIKGQKGRGDEVGMGKEVRPWRWHAARPLPAPGLWRSWDKPPLAVLCLREAARQPGHVPLPAASPTPLPAQPGGTSWGRSFHREGSDSTSGTPVPRRGGDGEEAAPSPNSPAVSAATPSPACHRLCDLAAVDDPLRGCCYTP